MQSWIKQRYTIGKPFPYRIHSVDVNDLIIHKDEDVTVRLHHDGSLHDRFIIRTFSNGELWVHYGTSRSLRYAYHAMNEIHSSLELGYYEGGPDIHIRGIIEGFYGTPWPHHDRLDVISFLKDYRMNAYFYAPKDDPYHRHLWREPYPEIEFKRFLELVHHAQACDVDFYFCISPGQDFIYTEEHEFDVLFRKIDLLIKEGVTHYSLLMDDIDYVLKGESKDRFQRPGVAHAYISNRLHRYLQSQLKDYVFVMCPTEYWQNWDTEYRKDLREGLDPDIHVFWTGYNTVAEYIPNEDGIHANGYFGHPLILWDNYPVNDMAMDHLFMGPLVNRGTKLYETHVGMVSNPMISWHLSKIPVITMADYMWDSAHYDPEKSYKQAIDDLSKGDQTLRRAITIFADENRPSLIHYQRNASYDKMIEHEDFIAIDRYFQRVYRAMRFLKKQTIYPAFSSDAMPWIERFIHDYATWNKFKKGLIKPNDVAYIEQAKHVMGYQVIARILKHAGLYQGKIYKKERPNFWDNPQVKR